MILFNLEICSFKRLFVDLCSTVPEKTNLSLLNWLVLLMKKLEKKYPESFDSVISDKKYSSVTKQIMGLQPDYKGQSELFEKLHHPNVSVRIAAVNAVPEQLEPIQVLIIIILYYIFFFQKYAD